VLEEVGLFDEGFFLYYEDTDFCFRVRKQGYRVVYVPAATAVHVESVTTDKNSLSYMTYFHTGRWRFLLKQFSTNMLLNKSVVAERAWLKKADYNQLAGSIIAYRAARHQWVSIIEERSTDTDDEQQNVQIKEALLSLHEEALSQICLRKPEESSVPLLMLTGQLQERPFVSNVPIIGSFIARFREMWNNVATKWYVRPIIVQQNQLNKEILERLHQLDNNFIDMKREQVDMIYTAAELTDQLEQTNHLLQSINDRLIDLENRDTN